jgi:uncharacterized membrane protein YhaH (DUF805 family)
MGPAQAIRTGFAKSFQSSGRSTRSEFWWFAPIGLGLPIGIAAFAPPAVTSLGSLAVKILTVCFASLPFSSAAARRFQDTGEPKQEFWSGIAPTLGCIAAGYMLVFGLVAMFTIWGLAIGLLITLPSALAFFACLFLAPGALGLTIGQLLVPSQPHPNTYGPNPLEVTP